MKKELQKLDIVWDCIQDLWHIRPTLYHLGHWSHFTAFNSNGTWVKFFFEGEPPFPDNNWVNKTIKSPCYLSYYRDYQRNCINLINPHAWTCTVDCTLIQTLNNNINQYYQYYSIKFPLFKQKFKQRNSLSSALYQSFSNF